MPVLHSPEAAVQWLRQTVSGTLESDSRLVRPGDGFIAWPGTVVDGRRYVADALQRGAVACLVDAKDVAPFGLDSGGASIATLDRLQDHAGAIASAFFGQPSERLAVVAVTGTNGKTSTVWWLAQALSALPDTWCLPCAMVGTLGVGRANSESLVSTGMTTPDPILLQRSLRQFADSGLRACAMEASSIGIEERRLNGTRIAVAVFTNLTQDHLDYHGDMPAYWAAKHKLFAWPGLSSAVVNIDDSYGVQLAQDLQGSALDVWTVSCQGPARLQARTIRYEGAGLCFEVAEGTQTETLSTCCVGTYNVANLLGVIAAMRALGVPLPAAIAACAALQPVPGRMECLGAPGEPLVAVDYAHTPDALSQALAALRPLAAQRGGRLWCVFGCGGDRDPSKRPMMGAIAFQGADQLVVTSDNPRSEKPEAIIAQILLGLPQDNRVHVQSDRALAIAQAIGRSQPQDVVLLAGKGHEATQEVAGVKSPFSDRDHAQRALRARSNPSQEANPCTP